MAAIPEENKCAYNFVGKSGLKVSNLCFGAMTFGKNTMFGLPNQTPEDEGHKIMDRFIEWGGNFIDTADVYGSGESEEYLGRWLEKRPRENVVIATKARFPMGTETNKNNEGLSRRHLTASIDNSLRRLKTDYVDIYQTHGFDTAVPLEETYRTLDDLVRCGKVRYVGLSNVTGWQIQRIVDIAEKLGLNSIISLQQQYSLVCRESEQEPFQVCKAFGLGVLPWSPLKGGQLTGKVKRGQEPTEGRSKWVQDNKANLPKSIGGVSEKDFDVIEAVEKIAKAKGKTMAQVALRWCVQRDVVSSTIIGARTLAQLDDNMAASNSFSLTKEEMDELTKVSAPELGYPYEVIVSMNADRVNKMAHNFFVESTY